MHKLRTHRQGKTSHTISVKQLPSTDSTTSEFQIPSSPSSAQHYQKRPSSTPPRYRCDIFGCNYSSTKRSAIDNHKKLSHRGLLVTETNELSSSAAEKEFETASYPDSVGLRRSKLSSKVDSPSKKVRRRLFVDDLTSHDSTSSDFMERICSMSVTSHTSENMSTDSDTHSVSSTDSLRRSARLAKRANQQQRSEDSTSRKKSDGHEAKQKQRTRSRTQSKNMSTDSDTSSVSSTDSLKRSARVAERETKQRTQDGASRTKNVDDARKHKQKHGQERTVGSHLLNVVI